MIVGVVVALALALAASPASAGRRVSFEGRYRPATLFIADHSYYHAVSLTGVSWQNWNGAVATGQGSYSFRFCPPHQGECALSPSYAEIAVVRLSMAKACHGRLGYTRLSVTTPGSQNSLFEPFQETVAAC